MIQFKRGQTKTWKASKVILADGQPGYDKDKHKIKIGDGKSAWDKLPYASGLSEEDILSSEKDAKAHAKVDPENKTLFTYGTEAPDQNTVGQVYLQHYEAEPEADYVVSSGINGNWTYQKWKSGIARCWGNFELTTPIQLAIGSDLLYQSNNTLQKSYPITFEGVPSESATVQSPGSVVWLSASKGLNTQKKSAIYSLISPDKVTNTATYTIALKVEGFWR